MISGPGAPRSLLYRQGAVFAATKVLGQEEDRKNEDSLDTVWTGVVPVYGMLGEPIPG
jgi:hypothetical protein